MGGVDFVMAPVALEHYVVYAELVCHGLQFAMVIGDAHRTNVGALSKQKLNSHFAVFT
jgi:hypothetical protein